MSDFSDMNTELEHYGTKRHSGRYAWGSGEVPYQHEAWFVWKVNELKKRGLTEKEIADSAKMTVRELRARTSAASDIAKQQNIRTAIALREKGYSPKAIAKRMNKPYNTVTGWLKEDALEKRGVLLKTADDLEQIVSEKKYIDVGRSSEYDLGISRERLENALVVMKDRGYTVENIYVDQGGGSKKTTTRVLAPPGTTVSELYSHESEIVSPSDIAMKESGPNVLGIRYPKSISSDRVYVKYAEDGGKEMDGVIQLRRGVEDISLGGSTYAQVRIAVDKDRYLKGVAIYGDDKDIPEGYDIVVNSNKSKAEYPDKTKVFKEMNKDKNKNIIVDNPFGATIKKNGQRMYIDENGEEQQSVINKVNEEQDWNNWSKSLASQFLSKQPVELIRTQLNKTYDDHEAEFDEISKVTNPILKKELLLEFANKCDSDAVTLKAAALPGQTQALLLPVPDIPEGQIYAPRYENGEKLALVRYPHAGTFEIPVVTVNNNFKQGKDIVGPEAFAAVGINAKTAAQLSGADFDGDTATVIPLGTKEGSMVRAKPMLKDLEGFETSDWHAYEGMPKVTPKNFNKQMEMGKASNLINDMTLKGATEQEIARADKYSMVVIDAEKHNLDWKGAYAEYGIADLKKEYQGGKNKGASTLISQAKAEVRVPQRKEYQLIKDPETGKTHMEMFDPITGAKLYSETGESYIKRTIGIKEKDPDTGETKIKKHTVFASKDYEGHRVYDTKKGMTYTNDEGQRVDITPEEESKVTTKYFYKSGSKGSKEITYLTPEQVSKMKTEEKKRSTTTTKMALALEKGDAHLLSSGTDKEEAYADYANKLYALANKTRLEYNNTQVYKRDTNAARIYANEVRSLQQRVVEAKKNEPIERKAQRIANVNVKAFKEDNPDASYEDIKKYRGKTLQDARMRLHPQGRTQITLTDKEWEAIQAHAVSPDFFRTILRYSDKDYIKRLASGRKETTISEADLAKARAWLYPSNGKTGKTWAEVAAALGVSQSTLYDKLNA